jgi:hypothetical protein
MSQDHDSVELNERERRLFALLPREAPLDLADEEQAVAALRAEGFFHGRTSRTRRAMLSFAAAAALVVAGGIGGGVVGARIAARTSLEGMLMRNDLSTGDRILLLQRAGSAYVQAAHAYAAATAQTDSTAVEVAAQVLRGAANAVVRSRLDGGVAARLTEILEGPIAPTTKPVARPVQQIIWF